MRDRQTFTLTSVPLLFLLAALLMGGMARGATTQPTTQPVRMPAIATSQAGAESEDFTSLSIDELMNVEVTSVSKQPQKISEASASVTDRRQRHR